jgi:hypothetical protein
LLIVEEAVDIINQTGFHVAVEDDLIPRAALHALPEIATLAPVTLIHDVYFLMQLSTPGTNESANFTRLANLPTNWPIRRFFMKLKILVIVVFGVLVGSYWFDLQLGGPRRCHRKLG